MTLLNLFFLVPWAVLMFFAVRYVALRYYAAGERANAVAGAVVVAFGIGALLPNFRSSGGPPAATAEAPAAAPAASPSASAAVVVEHPFQGDPDAVHAPPVTWDDKKQRFVQLGRPLQTGPLWTFSGTTDGFTASPGAHVQALPGGGLDLTNGVYGSSLRTPPRLGLNGKDDPVVLVRLTRTKPGAGWAPAIYYQTDGHGESPNFYARVYRGKNPQVGETVTLVFDMAKLSDGGSDWTSSRIEQIRLQTDDQPGGEFTIREFALSRPLFR